MKKQVTILTAAFFLVMNANANNPLIVIAPQQFNAGTVIISEPGLYVLGGDPIVTITVGAALSITTSDVILDLTGKTIRGSGGSDTGISIAQGLENITVRNGGIFGFNQRGIVINRGASNFTFEDLRISGTSKNSNSFRGFYFVNGPTNSQNITIRNCKSTNGLYGAYIDTCANIDIENCLFTANRLYGSLLSSCTNIDISQSAFNSNGQRGLTAVLCDDLSIADSNFDANGNDIEGFGILLENVDSLNIARSTFNFNGITPPFGGTVAGGGMFLSSGIFSGAIIKSSQFNNNTGNSAEGISGDLATIRSWTLSDCDCSFNQGTVQAGGMRFNSMTGCLVESCKCSNNTATGDPVLTSGSFGILLSGGNGTVIRNCIANSNVGRDLASGISHSSAEATLVEGCIANHNTFVSAPFGVSFSGFASQSARSAFIDCLAIGNGHGASSLGIGFFLDQTTSLSSIVKNCTATANVLTGFFTDASPAFLTGNLAMGNGVNYDGVGTYSFVTVSKTVPPPTGTFDERMIDNISII